jgi:protoheme IX farnesyltransferase
MANTAVAAPLTARDLLGIFKPRIALMIALSALGGAAISPGAGPPSWQIALTALAVFLAAASAGAFNQWAESDLDARMERTAARPFASGRLHPGLGWLGGIVALLAFSVGVAALVANGWAALYTFLGAFTYAVVYTLWLKRRSWTNIVVGGAAGSFAVLAGAAAVSPALGAEAVLLAVVLFLWTPPHFWSLAIAVEDDYRHNAVPMLPALIGDAKCAWVIFAHAAALSMIALVPAWYGMGVVYLICAAAGGLLFTGTSLALVLRPDGRTAIRNFLASLVQLLLLLSGAMLDGWLAGGLA